jgi:hypothetical protein
MQRQPIVFTSAMLAILLAVTCSTRLSHAERLSSICVAKPHLDPPLGSHWYSSKDPETGRQCWFLKVEGSKAILRQVAPIPLPRSKPGTTVIAEIPVEDTPAEAKLTNATPGENELVAPFWFSVTTGSYSPEHVPVISVADGNVTKALRDDVPRIPPAVAEASVPAADPLPARAILTVFAGALLFASIVAGLVRGLSGGTPA